MFHPKVSRSAFDGYRLVMEERLKAIEYRCEIIHSRSVLMEERLKAIECRCEIIHDRSVVLFGKVNELANAATKAQLRHDLLVEELDYEYEIIPPKPERIVPGQPEMLTLRSRSDPDKPPRVRPVETA